MKRIFFTLLILMIQYDIIACSKGKRKISDLKSENNQKDQKIWEQDLGDSFKIDASTQGLQRVHLKCGADSMHVQLETDIDFDGVMYTKGSFYEQTEPCFVKPKIGKSSRSLAMRFSLDQCQTIQDGEVYSNVVVVQHDPDLITPGDAAFALECDFRQPRSLNVESSFQARDRLASGSSITLISPDPTVNESSLKSPKDTVHNDSSIVTFIPNKINEKKVKKVKGTVESVRLDKKRTIGDEL